MDPRKLFSDSRFSGLCAYCGAQATTVDHVPSRVLLDEPLPDNLAVVGACEACNQGFSRDEQYLACLVECALVGTTDPAALGRPKVARILRDTPRLATRIESSRTTAKDGTLLWQPELDRVAAVALKLARGHAAYEFSEPQLEPPESCVAKPLSSMSASEREAFEDIDSAPAHTLWPEIGSRAFHRAVVGNPPTYVNGWNVVQEGRYRYWTHFMPTVVCRGVLSEYLAFEVAFP